MFCFNINHQGCTCNWLGPKSKRKNSSIHLYHFQMKTWPGGLLTCLLGGLQAELSPGSGRCKFIGHFLPKVAYFLWGGGGANIFMELNPIILNIYELRENFIVHIAFVMANRSSVFKRSCHTLPPYGILPTCCVKTGTLFLGILPPSPLALSWISRYIWMAH